MREEESSWRINDEIFWYCNSVEWELSDKKLVAYITFLL